jgi:hypothetical protein
VEKNFKERIEQYGYKKGITFNEYQEENNFDIWVDRICIGSVDNIFSPFA